MSLDNLRIRAHAGCAHLYMTLGEIAEARASNRMRPTEWQRSQRWGAASASGWVESLLNNRQLFPLVLHRVPNRDAGGFDFEIIDGQNRSNSARLFVCELSATVRAGAVLMDAPEPDAQMRLDEFSPMQRAAILGCEVAVHVYPPETTQAELRAIFRDLNMGAMLNSHEIIHSWTHLPLIGSLINPVNTALEVSLLEIAPRWRSTKCRMMHTWVRIAALVMADGLHLGGASHIEAWVASTEGWGGPSAAERRRVIDVVERTVAALKAWRAHGEVFSITTVPDLAWVFAAFGCTDRVADAVAGPLLAALKTDPGGDGQWVSHAGITSYDATCSRRECAGFHMCLALGLDSMPPLLTRHRNDQPDGVVVPPPADNAELGAMQDMTHMLAPPEPQGLSAAGQARLRRILAPN